MESVDIIERNQPKTFTDQIRVCVSQSAWFHLILICSEFLEDTQIYSDTHVIYSLYLMVNH